MVKPYLSKSGGGKKRNHYKGSSSGGGGGVPAHTPSHLKKINTKKVKYSS